jgi:hypothetical protein
MHVARDDIRVHVDRDGTARVEHKVLLLVSGGPLKSFTIRGVDGDAALEDGAFVIPEADDEFDHPAPGDELDVIGILVPAPGIASTWNVRPRSPADIQPGS